jgi:hypothetical protein
MHGDDQLVIPAESWPAVRDDLAELLDTAESGGAAAARQWLELRGLMCVELGQQLGATDLGNAGLARAAPDRAGTKPRMRVREVLLTRRTLLVAVGGALGVVLLVLFGWFWAAGVPALYRGTPGDDNARLSAISTTRVGLLAGFVGIGALGTLWLNNRVYRITARTFQLTEGGSLPIAIRRRSVR